MIENMRGRSTETKYGRAPLWLYETGVGLQAIATYTWLHGRYGHYERVMPSYATLAKELGVSRGSVIAYVKALTSVGAVRIETSGAAGRQTNRYVIAFNEPFRVAGQNTDQGGGGQDADRSAGCTSPSQPADRGGQPVVQEEDVSTKTFFEEDEDLSRPSLPTQRPEPDPVHEREIISPFEDLNPQQPNPPASVDVYTAQPADTDDAARVADSWTEAYKRSSNGSTPSVKAVSRVRASAASRLRAGKTVDDLILIAVDMAETNLAWTDLAEHEAHWLNKQQQNGLTGTDATVSGWMALADQLSPSTTDARVQGALALGRQMQAEHNARGGHQPYRDSVWDDMTRQLASGARPDGWERYPHCGHPDCDPITRGREVEDGSGLKSLTWCTACHPNLQF
jgi:hypothetical protein